MKKLLLGFLAVVMLWGFNVSADEASGTIDIEVKDKNLSEIVAIVSDINVKENVQGVTYQITNEKAVLSITLVDSTRYDETITDVFAIDGVEALDENANNEVKDNVPTTTSETSSKCDGISDKDLNSIITANYILYATLVILLILIVVIIALLFKNKDKDTKKKK